MNIIKSIDFLIENAGDVIKYKIDDKLIAENNLLSNNEIDNWFKRLCERSKANNIGDIHGSHDYRMENILGKCFVLGLSKKVIVFNDNMNFIIKYLNNQISISTSEELTFEKLYNYRDNQKVLSSFLPFLGFYEDFAIKQIVMNRIEVLFEFTKLKDYNIYVDGSKFKGVKKEWQPYFINSKLYSNGHISLPDIHDLIMFAYLSIEEKIKVETIVNWLFDDRYKNIIRRYGNIHVTGGNYNCKAIIFKLNLIDFKEIIFDKGDLNSLLFNVYILSFFKSARESVWFSIAIDYLNQYKTDDGIYKFPTYMITKKSDRYVIFGGHMNVGENNKNKLYNEIISTYWMSRIYGNINKNE